MTEKKQRTPLQIAADGVDAAHTKLAGAEAAALKGKDYAMASEIADTRKTVQVLLTRMNMPAASE